MSGASNLEICIVGGCGHVGLPLGLAFADSGCHVTLYDLNQKSVEMVNLGLMPFKENDAPEVLKRVRRSGHLEATVDARQITRAEVIIMVIGTPVDEYLNPRQHDIFDAVKEIEPYLSDNQLLVMRSTLFPGTTEAVHQRLVDSGRQIDVAFCPERIAEGYALRELVALPQIVSGCTPSAVKRAGDLFDHLAPKVVELPPTEAEFAKLVSNNYRYIQFAMGNEFYRIAEDHGLDYSRIHAAVTLEYPRLAALTTAGFAAGPCLRKDTLQLAAFAGPGYQLGQAALLVNEGMPDSIVGWLQREVPDLRSKTVGVLGMAFKAGSDDPRDSLSYKLRKKLMLVANMVFCTDVHIQDPRFVTVEELVERSDIVVVATPHPEYRSLDLTGKHVVDIWNFYGNGGRS